MRAIKQISALLTILLIQHCAPSRFVKPLQKKEQAASFSFGGPMIRFGGAPIPIPFTTLCYGYGISNKISAFGSLHTTSLLFGNLQNEVGATFNIYQLENKFGVSLSPALQTAYRVGVSGSARVWPSAEVNGWYHPGGKPSYLYGGINSWFELSAKKAHNETVTQRVVPNLQIGYMHVKQKWMHQFQLAYLGIGSPILPGVVDYIGLSGKGALGVHYAIIRKF